MNIRNFLALLPAFAAASGDAVVADPTKVTPLLEVVDAAGVARPKGYNPVLSYNAALEFRETNRPWIDVTFGEPATDAKEAFAAVFFETDHQFVVPPLDERRIPDGGRAWPNVWLEYDRFVFDYRNDGTSPVRVVVLVQDFVSWLPLRFDGLASVAPTAEKQALLPQLYEEEVELPPGEGTAVVDLRKPLWCNNQKKGLSLDNIKAFGLCLRNPIGKTTIGLNRFRLESDRSDAGAYVHPTPVRCPSCARGFGDRYSPFCPFCGAEMPEPLSIPSEVPQFDDDIVVLPAVDAGGGGGNSGGGDDTSEKPAGSKGSQAVRHYDVYYNRAVGSLPIPHRKRPQWEYRYQLKFALGEQFNGKPRIKRATLWLTCSLVLNKHPEPVFCQKPWLPGLAVFSIPDVYNNWRGPELSLSTTPPYEKLIYVGGQHTGPATQDPKLRVPGKKPPNCLPIDVTEFMRQAVEEGRQTIGLGLKGFTPFGAVKDPHSLGHTMNFYALGHEKSPVIAVEFER